MQGRWFIREQVYVCGDLLTADIYPVFQPAGVRRKKCRPTRNVQRRLNEKNARLRFRRLLLMNFTEEDIVLHLTYAEAPDAEQAKKDIVNFLARVARKRKKAGLPPMKYMRRMEYGRKSGRIHHHVILSGGLDRDELEQCWGLGFADAKRLQLSYDEGASLARYMTKDGGAEYRRWSCSKNMTRPEPAVFDGRIGQRELRQMENAIETRNHKALFEGLYPDFWLETAEAYQNEINKGSYIHVEMRRRQ